MDLLISLIVVTISKSICISKHHVVQCKYIQFLFVTHVSVKLKKLLLIKMIYIPDKITCEWMAKESLITVVRYRVGIRAKPELDEQCPWNDLQVMVWFP